MSKRLNEITGDMPKTGPNAGLADGSTNIETGGATGALAAKPKASAPKAAPKTYLVLDSTAKDGPRIHEMLVNGAVRPFVFKPGEALELDAPIALKFLKHDAFWAVNAKGERIAISRRPRQPEELGAGERFRLGENETVANYTELTTDALIHRAVELPGGEQYATGAPDRAAIIAFIKQTTEANRKANTVNENDADGYTPEAELDDEAEAA